MELPHQNFVLEYNFNNQHMINTIEEFEITTVESPNDIRLKTLAKSKYALEASLKNTSVPMESN
jgi:hypothetical protein